MNKNIQVSGLLDVDSVTRRRLYSALSSCYGKLQRVLNNDLLLRTHFKRHRQSGSRQRFEVRLHLSVPGLEVSASALEWNALSALQSAISELEREVIEKVKR